MKTLSAQQQETLARLTDELMQRRRANGVWKSELSPSALSTATSCAALSLAIEHDPGNSLGIQISLIDRGLRWLADHQNSDGGWGDTPVSKSNISTTTLCWAALQKTRSRQIVPNVTFNRAEDWLRMHMPDLQPHSIARAILKRYGKDRTFSVPILTMCALCGVLGEGREAWEHVIPLPFELAALPHSTFAALRLPVVSYALPALIAIGQARHVHRPSSNPALRTLRNLLQERTLTKLRRIQPESGGYLEATPLTGFVLMSLIGSVGPDHPVAHDAAGFLIRLARANGSWAIDVNLDTWVTTLAINALAEPENESPPDAADRKRMHAWLLSQQYRETHPYTNASPGGWAWTPESGGVPDADDTSGALTALANLRGNETEASEPASRGLRWLTGLQNRDGGIPTFCRGWGTLPFDRSSTDISAHALRASLSWRLQTNTKHVNTALERRILQFLFHTQNNDGSWKPLWFGNEHEANEANFTYGTSRVTQALAEAAAHGALNHSLQGTLMNGIEWLLQNQNRDGGWGGAYEIQSSIEETAVATEALATAMIHGRVFLPSSVTQSIQRGLDWLVDRTDAGQSTPPAPIGFYFANLWYYEELYPLIFTVAAMRKAAMAFRI